MSCGRGNPVRVSFMGAELSPHQLEEAGVFSGRRVQMTQQGWRKGKCVSRADFLAAVKKFRTGKVGG